MGEGRKRTGKMRLFVDGEARALRGALQVDAQVRHTHYWPLAVDQFTCKPAVSRLHDDAASDTELPVEPWPKQPTAACQKTPSLASYARQPTSVSSAQVCQRPPP